MVICGQELSFSALNADDIERTETAQKHMEQASDAEKQRPKTGLADAIRGQCRLVMGYLDEVLGEGAAARLGLNGRDFAACKQVMDAFAARIAEEQEALQPHSQPTNREQRRAQQRTRTAGRIVSQPPVNYPKPQAARMVERVDKAARRKALLAELAELENG